MIRRTTTARPIASGPSQGPPQPGPSHREQPQTTLRLPYPPADFGLPPKPTPPYPTQGYCVPVVPQVPRPPGPSAPPQAQSPSPPEQPTYCQTERNCSQTSAHPSLPCLPTQPGRSSSDAPDWTPTFCSRWQTRPQPSEQTPTRPSRPTSFSEEWGWQILPPQMG